MRTIINGLKGFSGSLLTRVGIYRTLLKDSGVVIAFPRVDDHYRSDPITDGEAKFRSFCQGFKDTFSVIDLPAFLDDLDSGGPMVGKMAIAFDDGYLDNLTVPRISGRPSLL